MQFLSLRVESQIRRGNLKSFRHSELFARKVKNPKRIVIARFCDLQNRGNLKNKKLSLRGESQIWRGNLNKIQDSWHKIATNRYCDF